MMNILVFNLNIHVENSITKALFSPYGEGTSLKVIIDNETGNSLRYGFVDMPD